MQDNSGYCLQGGAVRKVIVIDDEPFILMMIEDKLKKAKIGVITLRESRNALEVIKKEKPNLVILDWMMPELSGIDLCKLIKGDSELSDIPIFMLTAKGQDSDEQLGLQCGVSRYITKPFSPKSLLEMVQEAIGNE
jgi:two-component system, OmpR family, alkaline phosphatase synthesis response regulator PhoP